MLLVILALLVTAAVVDVAVESAFADGTSFVGGGQELATGFEPEVVTLAIAGAAALAGMFLVATIGARRRRSRRINEETRREQLSQGEASLEARKHLIEGRLEELQQNHDELLQRRDGLLVEVERLRERHDELEERVRERHRDIATARKALADIDAGDASIEDDLVVVTDDEVTVVPEPADSGAESPRA